MPEMGWYSDPLAGQSLRYWDGCEWTEQLRPWPNADGVPQLPAPGWYCDPAWDGRLRLWSGTQWSDLTRPIPSGWTIGPSASVAERRSWVQGCAVVTLLAILAAVFGLQGPSPPPHGVVAGVPPGWIFVDVSQRGPAPADGLASTTTVPTTTMVSTTTTTTTITIERPPEKVGSPVEGTKHAAPLLPTVPATTPPANLVPMVQPARQSLLGSTSDFVLIGYRWNACQTITVSSSGPDVHSIVAELAKTTGLHLAMVSGGGQIEVSWGTIAIEGGIGDTSLTAEGGSLVHATVVIALAGTPFLPTLIRHELGHALGLGHASRPDEVMFPVVKKGSPLDYQAGDQAGLRAVGAPASGC